MSLAANSADWKRDGYCLLPAALEKAPLQALGQAVLARYGEVARNGKPFRAGGTIAGHLGFAPGKAARQVVDDLNALNFGAVVCDLAARPMRLSAVYGNLNLPGSRPQHFHADSAFDGEFVVVNIALVDATKANGSISLAPRTASEPLNYASFVLRRFPEASLQVDMTVGDILIRSSNLWHRGMPNSTPTPRPMLALTYLPGRADASGDVRIADDIQFNPNFYTTGLSGLCKEVFAVRAAPLFNLVRFAKGVCSPPTPRPSNSTSSF